MLSMRYGAMSGGFSGPLLVTGVSHLPGLVDVNYRFQYLYGRKCTGAHLSCS